MVVLVLIDDDLDHRPHLALGEPGHGGSLAAGGEDVGVGVEG